MLNYFPGFYPDELLYSIVSRYAYKVGIQRQRYILDELFDKYNTIVPIDFPYRIARFVSKLPNVLNIGSRDVIYNHTMFPLFYPFFDTRRQEVVYQKMIGDNGQEIHMMSGSMGSSITMLNYLRYCPQCIREDYKTYGEAYWHRSHNIPGVYICHKHNVSLSEKEDNTGRYICNMEQEKLLSLSEVIESGQSLNGKHPTDVIWNARERQLLFECAKSINELLNYNFRDAECSIKKVREVYFNKLLEKGFVINQIRIQQEEIKKALISYYGENILELMNLSFPKNVEYSWVKRLLNKKENICHPLKHIIIINWLYGGKVEAFIRDTKKEYCSFKNSYWPCLNPVAEHYKQDVIQGYKIKYDSKKQYHFVVFECGCGYKYTRKLAEIEDRFKVSRTLQYGEVWEKKLKDLVEQGNLSKIEIARKMHVHVSTVASHINRMEQMIDGIKNKVEDNSEKEYSAKSQRENEVKDRLLSYISQHKTSRAELERRFPKEVHWLRAVNNLLLKSILERCCYKSNNRVDWKSRDCYLYEITKCEIERMRSSEELARITINRVGKNIGHLAVLQKHLDKLPMTKKVLLENIETPDVYRERKSIELKRY